MSLSHITILSDSDAESNGSSTSHVILSDSEAAVVVIPAIALEIAPEEPPSPDTYRPHLIIPAILVRPGQAMPFGRPYLINHNGIRMTAKKRVRAPPTLSSAIEAIIAQWIVVPPPLLTGSSLERSRISYSSLETSHPSSLPPLCKRCRVLIYSSSSTSLSPSPSVGPSHKRCRSPTSLLPVTVVSTPPIEMLPPHKRFIGSSYVPQEDVYVETTVEARLDDHSEMIEEMYEHLLDIPFTRLKTTKHEAAEQRDEISRDRISKLEYRLRYAEYRIQQDELARVSDIEQHLGIKMPTTRQGASIMDIKQLIAQCVTDVMATFEANQNNQNGTPQGTSRGTGGTVPTTHGSTYKEFLNCQPYNFKGTEGAVRLTRWFEKMEYVFHISNYTTNCQVKYATCTLQDSALTWWNSHVKTVGIKTAYEMSWKEPMKMMTEVYYPRNEIQKMENEL
ncbi:hypothetical protein Tco_1025954 [Tanacetum coccineum]